MDRSPFTLRRLDGNPILHRDTRGPRLFDRSMRHSALLARGDELLVFWSRAGDCPERILCSPIRIEGDWTSWRADPELEVLEPAEPWEGGGPAR